MALPISKSELERLGHRLVAGSEPDPSDLVLLRQVLDEYGRVLESASIKVRENIGAEPTPRVKSLGTVLEKLERNGGAGLRTMQDLAGMRIVKDFDRRQQDELCAALTDLFPNEDRPPRIVDRREDPVHGYRAVHVIVFPEGLPVEIQVRTKLQDEWANLFEKLADAIGRGIRYGHPPDPLPEEKRMIDEIHRDMVDMAMELSDEMDDYERRGIDEGGLLRHRLERVGINWNLNQFAEYVDAAASPGGPRE